VVFGSIYIYNLYAVKYSSKYRETDRAEEIRKGGIAENAECQENLSSCHFGHARHRFGSPALIVTSPYRRDERSERRLIEEWVLLY